MEQAAAAEHEPRSNRRERIKKSLLVALIAVVCAILLYIFIWFGTQLGLQG